MNLDDFVWRETDARRINAVLNDPVVRPWVADMGEGRLDVSPIVANPANILLMGQWGGCVFFCPQPGLYEVHTQILPNGRGEWARQFVQAAAHWMFTHTAAYEIMTRVPHGHVAARALTIAAGGRHEFTRDDGVVFRGAKVGVDIFSYRIQDWVQTAPWLIESGQHLHLRMAEEAKRLGITDAPHADDENHNRYSGACLDMAMNGQVRKAVLFYNRWAFAARHPLVALVSETPPVIKFDIGYLAIRDGDIEVVRSC